MRNSILKIAKSALQKLLPRKLNAATEPRASIESGVEDRIEKESVEEKQVEMEPTQKEQIDEQIDEKPVPGVENRERTVVHKLIPKTKIDFELDTQIVSLLTSILDGSEGAGEVLNDYFEERGEPRCVSEDFDYLDLDDRLLLMLDDLLPERIARRVAADFAEHALENAELPTKRVKEAKQFLNKCREFFQLENPTREMEVELVKQAGSYFSFIESESVANNQAIWSVWAVFMGKPSNVAIAARRTAVDENNWQNDHLVNTLPTFIPNQR